MVSKYRVWIFRILTIIATGLMLVSWILPWWKCHIMEVNSWMIIRPWALQTTLGEQFSSYIAGSAMPAFFAPAMWTYLSICVLLLLTSMFVKNKQVSLWKVRINLPQMMIGFVGLSYTVVVILMIVVAAIRTGDFYGTHLIGYTHVEIEYPIETGVNAALSPGYFLACSTAAYCWALAFLRNKILGISTPE